MSEVAVAARRGVGRLGGRDLASLHKLFEAAQLAPGLDARLALHDLRHDLADHAAGRVVADEEADLCASPEGVVAKLDPALVVDVGLFAGAPGDELARPILDDLAGQFDVAVARPCHDPA